MPDLPMAVPRAFAASVCAATVAEMDGETRYRTVHSHRCNNEHGQLLGVVTHSCDCGAVFYFLEEMLDSVVTKLLERERYVEITSIDRGVREYINGPTESEPKSD